MNSLITLNNEFVNEPFKILFYKALQSYEVQSLQDRITFLDNLTSGLEKVDDTTSSQLAANGWMRIGSGFGTAITISAFALVPFPFNALLSVASLGGAVTVFSDSITTDKKLKPVSNEIERHRLAVTSTTFLNWACLWEYCHSVDNDPNELFRALLYKASAGNVNGGKLIRFDGHPPFMAAIRALAGRTGRNYEDIANFVKAIQMRYTSQLEKPQIEEYISTPVKELPPAVGPVTQFSAIEVPAQQVQDYNSDSDIQRQIAIATLQQTFNKPAEIGLPQELREVMVDAPYSTFVIGMSGAGKDILVYNVISEIRKKYPQAFIIGIDGKNAPSERNLWAKPNYDYTIHFSMGDNPEDYHEELFSIFDKVDSYPPFTFIVFSELNGVRDSYISNGLKDEWQQIANKIRYIALQLNYAQKYFIATAQTANKEELGIGAGRQNAQFCMVSNGQQQSFINAVSKAAVFEGNGVKDTATWSSAISRSPAVEHLPNANQLGGIAYFHSAINRWMPMPRLHNAGQDRGVVSQQVEIPAPSPVFNQSTPAVEEAQVQTQQVALLEKPTSVPQVQSIFQQLAESYEDDQDLPLMSDYILWLEKKQGNAFTQRQMIQLWGNQKAPGAVEKRGVTSKDQITPYINEALDLEILKQTGEGYQVVSK